jgi:membrane-bound serine protease (ClpP class)
VRVLTNPAVASLLVALGVLLILADVYTGGFGAVGLAGIGLLALFFWGHALAGLAGWEGIALVLAGLLLIGVEAFVIPGFGLAGILGIAALLGGLFLSLIGGRIVTDEDLARAGYTVGGAFLLMLAGVVALVRLLPRAAGVQGLILQAQLGRADVAPRRSGRLWRWLEGPRLEAHTNVDAERPEQRASLRGVTGVALSALRPGGIARIGGERIDVVTQGEYIPAGAAIVVIADQGYRRVVRRAEDSAPADATSDE